MDFDSYITLCSPATHADLVGKCVHVLGCRFSMTYYTIITDSIHFAYIVQLLQNTFCMYILYNYYRFNTFCMYKLYNYYRLSTFCMYKLYNYCSLLCLPYRWVHERGGEFRCGSDGLHCPGLRALCLLPLPGGVSVINSKSVFARVASFRMKHHHHVFPLRNIWN